jgi:hypothetical protein
VERHCTWRPPRNRIRIWRSCRSMVLTWVGSFVGAYRVEKERIGEFIFWHHFPLQPNRVVHHVCSPLMMVCSMESLKCVKLLVQVCWLVDFVYSLMSICLNMSWFFKESCREETK